MSQWGGVCQHGSQKIAQGHSQKVEKKGGASTSPFFWSPDCCWTVVHAEAIAWCIAADFYFGILFCVSSQELYSALNFGEDESPKWLKQMVFVFCIVLPVLTPKDKSFLGFPTPNKNDKSDALPSLSMFAMKLRPEMRGPLCLIGFVSHTYSEESPLQYWCAYVLDHRFTSLKVFWKKC